MKGEKLGLSDRQIGKEIIEDYSIGLKILNSKFCFNSKYRSTGLYFMFEDDSNYSETIEFNSIHNIDYIFTNKVKEYLLSNTYFLIKRAKKGEEIKILSNSMKEALCDSDYIYTTLLNAVDRGVKVKMLLVKPVTRQNIDLFRDYSGIEIYNVEKVNKSKQIYNSLFSGNAASIIESLRFKSYIPHGEKIYTLNFNDRCNLRKFNKNLPLNIKNIERVY